MPRIAKELGPLHIKRITRPGSHPVGGVAGLMLQVTDTGTRSWVLRVMVGDRRRTIGLGAYPGVTLAIAREKAQAYRDKVATGIDPVVEREAMREALREQQQTAKALAWNFRRCAEAYIAAKQAGWRNEKHGKQWTSTLETYAYPVLGNMPVHAIHLEHVLAVIEPHWTVVNETINRVRNRIELILDWATVHRYRNGDNPARWKGNLDKLLADRAVVAPVVSHRALPAREMYDFMRKLRDIQTIGARCLEFVVLTASRSGETRLATWAEFDLSQRLWTIPAERMKSLREQRVPLSPQIMSLLKNLPHGNEEDLIFPGRKIGAPLSDMALTKVLRDMKVDAVPHGFRATFSSWVAASTSHPIEVREMALAHAIGNDTIAAYQRDDLFKKRRRLMKDWADFIDEKPSPPDSEHDADIDNAEDQ
jgi:integrase